MTGVPILQWQRHLRTIGPPVSILLLLLILWEGGVRLTGVEKWLLPAPSDILRTLASDMPLLLRHTGPTLKEAALGFAAGIAAGWFIAMIMELSPWLKRGFYPLLVGTQTVPIIAIAPLFILWFGYDLLPKVLIVALVTFFPVVVSTADGLRSADPDMVRLLRSMGTNSWQIFRMVRFPHALPAFFSGVKIAATYSVLGAVIAEWLGANVGLGVFLVRAQHSFAADRVFVAILAITFWTWLLFFLIRLLERMAVPWKQSRDKEPSK